MEERVGMDRVGYEWVSIMSIPMSNSHNRSVGSGQPQDPASTNQDIRNFW